MAWELKGESGKALNGTLRSLESLRVQSAVLTFQSLAADTLVWTATTNNATGAGTIVPTVGQVVELYRDGVRKFYGWAMRPKIGTTSVQVEIQGPWWWMNQIYLTSILTAATGSAAERVKYVFPTGPIAGMVTALLDRAITNGVPMIRGDIADMYDAPQVTVSNMTVAAALGKLLGRVPDAVTAFNYGGAAGTLPILKVARRNGADAMTELTYTVGTDNFESLRISPRLDLEVARVELAYMDRHPTSGKPRYQTQGSGTTAPGKRQIISVSGPEVVAFLPLDDFESATVKTANGTAISSSFVAANDPQLSAFKKSYGTLPGGPGTFLTYYTSGAGVKTRVDRQFPGTTFQRENGTYLTNLTGWHLVLTPDLPEWAMRQWKGIRVKITGTWIATLRDSLYGGSAPQPGPAFDAMRSGAITGTNFETQDTIGPSANYKMAWLARPFAVSAVLVRSRSGLPQNPPWTKQTKVYKRWDYDFITPPAGMASGLRTAQNWVPWEGPFTIVSESITGNNLINRSINIANCLPDCAAMKATAKSLAYDLMRRRITWTLGAPARIDFASAMGRVPINPQDVVVKIS